MKRHYTLRFNDLSNEKQLEIENDLRNDQTDKELDLNDGDAVTKAIWATCNKIWFELEVTND